MSNQPIFKKETQIKLANYLQHVDNLIDHYEKIKKTLKKINRAIILDCYKKNMKEKTTKMITWDQLKLQNFKRAYNVAIRKGKTKDDVILFEGDEYLMGYAKYLIQHVENVINKKEIKYCEACGVVIKQGEELCEECAKKIYK